MLRLPASLALTLACLLGAASACLPRAVGEPGYLHVIVKRLPQCDYGIGLERPLRVELVAQDRVVATAHHSGIYTGEESLWVAFHVPVAHPGRYRIRFGACPSLRDDPAAAVACEPIEWVASTTVSLTPRGIDEPEVVEYYRLGGTCMDGRRAH